MVKTYDRKNKFNVKIIIYNNLLYNLTVELGDKEDFVQIKENTKEILRMESSNFQRLI